MVKVLEIMASGSNLFRILIHHHKQVYNYTLYGAFFPVRLTPRIIYTVTVLYKDMMHK